VTPPAAANESGKHLRVDPVACDGVGMCAHLAAALVRLDSWGYPIVPARSLGIDEVATAARAVAGCPRRALELR
jgi:ferredoxin